MDTVYCVYDQFKLDTRLHKQRYAVHSTCENCSTLTGSIRYAVNGARCKRSDTLPCHQRAIPFSRRAGDNGIIQYSRYCTGTVVQHHILYIS
jgi:hypothetical protein